MVAFSGADHAQQLSDMSNTLARKTVIDGLEEIYKHTSTKIKNFKRMNWPTEPWALASYSFPK